MSAAFDVRAAENKIIPPFETVAVSIKLKCHLPDGYFMLLLGRSGLALTKKLTAVPGVIDSDYRDDIKAMLRNGSSQAFSVVKGQRVAQALLLPTYDVQWTAVPELDPAECVHRGFGSTGQH